MGKFQSIFIKRQKGKTVNMALQEAAKENGISITIGKDDRIGCIPNGTQKEAVAVNENLFQALASLGAEAEPSFELLMKKFDTQSDNETLVIKADGVSYHADVEWDYLSRRLDLWINLNELKETVQ